MSCMLLWMGKGKLPWQGMSMIGISLFLLAFAKSGANYPQDYFIFPIQHTPYLSGSFGELRSNHFHSGIDLKSSKGGSGDPLMAAADGWVTRIKVREGGYGNALYIAHPNGYTTVYGHMDKFTDAIDEYVKAQQYKKESFSIDLSELPKSLFPVKKGEAIGLMGTTGGSSGPHLHFEIRLTRNDLPLNPQLFGLTVKDTTPPKMHKLRVYHLNDKTETVATKDYSLRNVGATYNIAGDTLKIAAWRVGLALKVFDHMEGSSSWNGIYSMDTYVQDTLFHHFDFEKFSFDESRYINAHIDFKEQQTHNSYYHRAYKLPGNELSIYKGTNGVLPLYANLPTKVRIVCKDPLNNESTLEFYVLRSENGITPTQAPFNYVLPYDQSFTLDQGSLVAYLPKGALYENTYLQYDVSLEKTDDQYSPIYHIHHPTTPLHQSMEVKIKPAGISASAKSKSFIAYCNEDGKIYNAGGRWEGDFLVTRNRSFGDYSVMIDEVAPKITPIRFTSNMAKYNAMSFKISDNWPTTGNARDLKFHALVDGQWILMVHDGKRDLLTHEFDGRITRGSHTLRLEVTDHSGNVAVFERDFVR